MCHEILASYHTDGIACCDTIFVAFTMLSKAHWT